MTRTEEPPPGIKLPKSVLRWVALGLVVSSAVVGIITVLSGVTLTDLEKLGYLPFALASAVSLARLPVQNVRFRLIAGALAGDPKPDLSGSAIARMGSEFVALSTPSMIGGEFVRAAWLSGRGVDGGKALWIGYFEVMIDVYVGSAFALISAQYAFAKGAVVIGSTIVVIVLLLVVGYTVVFLIPAMRGIPILPKGLFKFAALFMGNERARRLEIVVQKGTETFSLAASQILRMDALALILKALGLTVIQVFLSGIALWFVLTAAGLKIDIISSTLIAGGTSAIAAIPISIGGSGVTELTMQSYLVLVFGFSSWAAVVLWRIASFQVVLAASGIAFLLLTHRSTKPVSSSVHLSPTDPPLEILVPGEITTRGNPASRAAKSPVISILFLLVANDRRSSASRGTHDLFRLIKEAPRHTC